MIRRRAPGVVLLAVAGATACNEDAFRQAAPAGTSSSAVTTASASAPSSSSASISNARWTAVARSPDAFELQPLRGALLVDAAGFLAVLGDGPLTQSPALMRGLEKGLSGKLYGAYPDGAWLVASDAAYRWTRDRWAPEEILHDHETLLDLVARGDGRALAAIGLPGNDMRFAVLGGDEPGARAPVPAPPSASDATPAHDDLAAGEESEKEAPCKVRMKPRSVKLAALPSGELLAAGYTCEPLGHGGAIVEHWAPNEARGTVSALPRGEGGESPRIAGAVAIGAGDMLVYGSVGVPPRPYVARSNGEAWSVEKAPLGGPVETLGATEDGTLWAAASGTAWNRKVGGSWEEVPLPAGLVTHAVWPGRGNAVWVAAREREGRSRAVLLRTADGHATEVVRLPPRNAMAGTIATSKRFFATSACEKVFAELYAAGPSRDATTGKPMPPPKDFASLKPLLDGDFAGLSTMGASPPNPRPGLSPVVDDDGERFYVGVVTPTRDLARKLVAAYQERNPGAASVVVCHDPAPAAGRAPGKSP